MCWGYVSFCFFQTCPAPLSHPENWQVRWSFLLAPWPRLSVTSADRLWKGIEEPWARSLITASGWLTDSNSNAQGWESTVGRVLSPGHCRSLEELAPTNPSQLSSLRVVSAIVLEYLSGSILIPRLSLRSSIKLKRKITPSKSKDVPLSVRRDVYLAELCKAPKSSLICMGNSGNNFLGSLVASLIHPSFLPPLE